MPDEKDNPWVQVGTCRKIVAFCFFLGVAAMFGLLVWTLWAASGAVIDWVGAHGW